MESELHLFRLNYMKRGHDVILGNQLSIKKNR